MCSDDFFKAQALLARESELAKKEVLKKSLHLKAEMAKKGMAIVVEKAALFEANIYKDMLVKELDVLMQWYDVEKRVGMVGGVGGNGWEWVGIGGDGWG